MPTYLAHSVLFHMPGTDHSPPIAPSTQPIMHKSHIKLHYTALQVVKALHETEETNARLHMYIEGLLANIIDKYPELLEKR